MSDSTPGTKTNLLGLSLQDLKDYFASLGEKPFRATQVFKWIHQRGLVNFAEMTDLSKDLRNRLSLLAEIKAPEITTEQCSLDGTRKWLMKLADGNQIETVFIPEKKRGTLCVSSQVGCALNCSFCSTATQGFNRNLTAAEIIGQVFKAKFALEQNGPKSETEGDLCSSITNVVMMGMGEPLLNFESVVKAMSIMRDDNAYQLPRRRVTLSTSGIVPKIDELSEISDVSLAVSLHAPFDPLRNELVPINKKYPIHELMNACRRYAAKDKRRLITMEYVMLQDVNDSEVHAKALVKILHNVPCKVNLIPFNPFEGAQYLRSTRERILQFRDIVTKAGFITTTRKTRGEDIDAACGQLKGKVMDRTSRQAKFNQSISQKLVLTRGKDLLAKEAVCLGKTQSA